MENFLNSTNDYEKICKPEKQQPSTPLPNTSPGSGISQNILFPSQIVPSKREQTSPVVSQFVNPMNLSYQAPKSLDILSPSEFFNVPAQSNTGATPVQTKCQQSCITNQSIKNEVNHSVNNIGSLIGKKNGHLSGMAGLETILELNVLEEKKKENEKKKNYFGNLMSLVASSKEKGRKEMKICVGLF
jgi:hypothetical protein